MSLRVMKFGGTSVGTPENIRNVKQIVEGGNSPAIVIVSALGGITDCLLRMARRAAAARWPAWRWARSSICPARA